MTTSPSFSNIYGNPVDFTNFKRVDWTYLPTARHPVEKCKFAKIQNPFFISGVGYFVFFKTCNEDGKTTNGTHEYVKCICQNGVFKCSFRKKTSECSGDNYSHSCVRIEFNRNSLVQHFLEKPVDKQ
jgi:hypothetical protein